MLASSGSRLNGLWLEFQVELCRLQIARRSVANYLAAPASTVARDDALEAIRIVLDRSDELLRSLAELPITVVHRRTVAKQATSPDFEIGYSS